MLFRGAGCFSSLIACSPKSELFHGLSWRGGWFVKARASARVSPSFWTADALESLSLQGEDCGGKSAGILMWQRGTQSTFLVKKVRLISKKRETN